MTIKDVFKISGSARGSKMLLLVAIQKIVLIVKDIGWNCWEGKKEAWEDDCIQNGKISFRGGYRVLWEHRGGPCGEQRCHTAQLQKLQARYSLYEWRALPRCQSHKLIGWTPWNHWHSTTVTWNKNGNVPPGSYLHGDTLYGEKGRIRDFSRGSPIPDEPWTLRRSHGGEEGVKPQSRGWHTRCKEGWTKYSEGQEIQHFWGWRLRQCEKLIELERGSSSGYSNALNTIVLKQNHNWFSHPE